MPFIATLDVVINFDKFRNVDLLSQGLYCVGVSISTQNGGIQGSPVSLRHSSTDGREGQYTMKPHDNHPKEEICMEEKKAFTHSFYIQYLEQIELLNEIVTFRLEAEATRLLRDDTLHVTLELFHIQRENMEGLPMEKPISRSKMPLLESRIIPLHGCGSGLHTYLPIAFNEWYFGVVSCSFHTCLVDVTYEALDNRNGYHVEQCLERLAIEERSTVQEASLSLFRSLASYLLHCFYDLRALVAEFTPQADPDIFEEPDWLYTRDQQSHHSQQSSDAFSPRTNRCRIVSGTDKQAVLERLKDPINTTKVLDNFAFPQGHPQHSAPVESKREPQTSTRDSSAAKCPANSPSSSSKKSSPMRMMRTMNLEAPCFAGVSPPSETACRRFSADTLHTFTDVIQVESDKRFSAPSTSSASAANLLQGVTLPPSYERPRSDIAYAGEHKELQLYPFGTSTISTITGWLVDDLTLEANGTPVAQLAELLHDRLAFVSKHTYHVWHQLNQRTMLSPASLFVGLAKAFFQAERVMALRTLQPAHASPPPPVSTATYFTYPHHSHVLLLEVPLNVRREGLDLIPLFQEETDPSLRPTPLLEALNETICLSQDSLREGVHLVVFVHGFRGNRFDFRLFRNYMSVFMLGGRMDYLLCQSLEKTPYQAIGQMGETLALEVQEHIASENLRIRKLSFVAHSMGAVVVRAALRHPLLEQYLPYFETYASFGAPHLGNSIVHSKVVDSAMWVLSTLKNAGCIQQLKLGDGFMHSLSCEDKLGHFRNVLFVSCDDDTFVTTESALVLLSPETGNAAAAKDLKLQQVADMARNINQHLNSTEKCVRLRITSVEGNNNQAKQSMMERFTGKGHHVAFLCNVSFIVTFLSLYKDFFA